MDTILTAFGVMGAAALLLIGASVIVVSLVEWSRERRRRREERAFSAMIRAADSIMQAEAAEVLRGLDQVESCLKEQQEKTRDPTRPPP
jgi:type II secretory pathway pseudopilin PulG